MSKNFIIIIASIALIICIIMLFHRKIKNNVKNSSIGKQINNNKYKRIQQNRNEPANPEFNINTSINDYINNMF